ncbi:MAG: hypothetical protein EXR79_06935 [Myxococcales bacterium]|nr:hypothetical protein [Myxococcales bacterium]
MRWGSSSGMAVWAAGVAGVCASGGAAWAQTAQVRLEISATTLAVDEELQLQVQASGDYEEVTEPTSEGFDFRRTGHQTQVTILGGRMQRVEVFVYAGTPRRPGRWAVGPVRVLGGGDTLATSNTIEVIVPSDDATAAPSMAAADATNPARYVGQPFFTKPAVTSLRPFAGQPFVITWELYWTRTVHVQGIRETTSAKFGGLDVDDLLKGETKESEPVNFGRHPYLRQVTRQMLATASAPGPVRLDGPAYRVEVGDFFESRVVKVPGASMTLNVRPIPTAGHPAGFAEPNVGKLELRGRLTAGGRPDEVRRAEVGERLLLTYEVVGSGNLLGLRDVRPPHVAGLTVEPLAGRADAGVRVSTSGVEGTRTWQYVVSFAAPGTYAIAAVDWAAFDPDAETFTASRVAPFEVEVRGAPAATDSSAAAVAVGPAGPDAAGMVAGASAGQAGVDRSAAAQLRPLAPDADLAATVGIDWTSSARFWRAALLPWALGLVALGIAWLAARRRRQAPDRARTGALAVARRRLDDAVRSGPEHGYAEVRAAIDGYLEQRADVRLVGVTDSAARHALCSAGANAPDADSLLTELQHLDFARFAPGGDREGDLGETATRVRKVLERLDAVLQALPAADPAKARSGAFAWLAVLVVGATVALPVRAGTLDDTFVAANRAYLARQWAAARGGYEALLRHGVPAPAVHYNLANTLVHEGRLGLAVGHYKRALRLVPPPALRGDVLFNLAATRTELADRARRRHAILHVFDESPSLEVAVARLAPRTLLGWLGLGCGWLALGCGLLAAWPRSGAPGFTAPAGRRWSARHLWTVTASLGVVHGVAIGWLAFAHTVDAATVHAVVVEEDATIAPCVGVGESMGLPEGLEVRWLGERADGRHEVRLPNGREGCLPASAVVTDEQG